MDPFMARTMVETLSKGINPVTGLALSYRDSCANEDVQDALIEVLAHCTIESAEQFQLRLREEKQERHECRMEENKRRYPRGGEPWSASEEQQLLTLHRQRKSIYQIAGILKRTPGAISDRLKKLQAQPIYRAKK